MKDLLKGTEPQRQKMHHEQKARDAAAGVAQAAVMEVAEARIRQRTVYLLSKPSPWHYLAVLFARLRGCKRFHTFPDLVNNGIRPTPLHCPSGRRPLRTNVSVNLQEPCPNLTCFF